MTSKQISSHGIEVDQLKMQFQQLEQEVVTKLKECGNCIESAERLNQEAGTLVKNLEDSLANVSNDAKEWQEIKVKLASTAVEGKVILDVGGEKYPTTVQTLTGEKNTFFTSMFSRQWQLERDPKDDSIFIDRDAKLFSHILAYLRTDTLPSDTTKDEALRQKLILEAKYFHFHNLTEMLTEAGRVNTLFKDGTLLSDNHKKNLAKLLDESYTKGELLYKASRDGFDVNAFHNKCNNKGVTVTIIRSSNNYLFGGYASVPWTSNGNYALDFKAFLFTLTNPHNIPPTKYVLNDPNNPNPVYHNGSYGPTFGGGHDLTICTNSNSSNSSYIGFPSSYTDTTGHGNNTFTGNRNFLTTDIEVFQLT